MASPATPPSPLGSGQRALVGQALAKPAAASVPMIHMARRGAKRRELSPPEKPQAPKQRRHQGRRARKTDHLHHDVGDDRARIAGEVMHRAVHRVIDARIGHRPARERERASPRRLRSAPRPRLRARGAPRKSCTTSGRAVERRGNEAHHAHGIANPGLRCSRPDAKPAGLINLDFRESAAAWRARRAAEMPKVWRPSPDRR